MKTSITKLKSSLFFSLAVLSFPLLAKPVAQVTEVKGQVFLITPDGKTKSLKVNDHLEEKSEVPLQVKEYQDGQEMLYLQAVAAHQFWMLNNY